MKDGRNTGKIYGKGSLFDLTEIDFFEVIGGEKTEKMLKGFSDLSGTGLALISRNGEVLISAGLPDALSDFYNTYSTVKQNCAKSKLIPFKGIDFYECLSNGLYFGVTDITISGEAVAALCFGPFRFFEEKNNSQKITTVSKSSSLDNVLFKNAQNLPNLKKKKLRSISALLNNFSDVLAQAGYANLLFKTENILPQHKALEELEENRQLLESIFNSSPVAKILVDRSANIIEINKAAIELTGYGNTDTSFTEPLKTGDFFSCISSFDNSEGCGFGESCKSCRLKAVILKSFEEKQSQPRQQSDILIADNGKLTEKSIVFSTMFLRNKGKDLVLINIENITQQKLTKQVLHDAEQKLEAFFKQSLDGFFFMMLDEPIDWTESSDKEELIDYVFRNQRTTKVNKALLDQYGFESETDYLCKTPNDFFKHDIETGKQLWRELFDKGQLHVETYELKKDGTPVWIEGDYVCLYNDEGQIKGHFGIQRDITAQKEYQLRIQETNEKLIESNTAKDKFFSIIAHDLRSPFNAMLGFTEMLQEACRAEEYKDAKLYSELVHSSAKQNYALLMNLLDWSRTQTKRMTFRRTEIHINELIQNIIALSEHQAQTKQIRIKQVLTPNIYISADKNMLETIIRNLVSNAVKYSYSDSGIIVNAHKTIETFYFSVQDFGVGISPENQQRLFKIDTGYSTHGTAQESGTGLGLILCKEFIKKHGGSIKVESKVGEGSLFGFEIPLKY